MNDQADPRWSAAVEALLTEAVERTRHRADLAGQDRKRRRTAVVTTAVTAIVLLVATVAVLHVRLRAEVAPAAPPAAITVDGVRIPYAGRIPWSDAIVASAGSDRVVVSADPDHIDTRFPICSSPIERVQVVETETIVTIAVLGYAERSDGGCLLIGRPPQPIAVSLRRPLGGRTLIDALDGHRSSARIGSASAPSVTGDEARTVAGDLLDHAPLPVGSTDLPKTSDSALTTPATVPGCSPLVDLHRFVRMARGDRDTIWRELRARTVPGLHLTSTGTYGDQHGVVSRSVVFGTAAPGAGSASLEYVLVQDGASVLLRIDAVVVQEDATCQYPGAPLQR